VDPDASHLGDEAPNAGGELVGQAGDGAARDVLDEVVTAPQFGDDPQHRQQEAKVGRHRVLQGQLLVDQVFDVEVQRVDEAVAFDDQAGGVAVTGQQGLGGGRDPFADEGEELHHLVVDLVELAV